MCIVYVCSVYCVVCRCRCVAYVICGCVVCGVSVYREESGREEEAPENLEMSKKKHEPNLGCGGKQKNEI